MNVLFNKMQSIQFFISNEKSELDFLIAKTIIKRKIFFLDYIKSSDPDNDDQGHKWSLR